MNWEIFEAAAPHESDRWAATDRGWLWDENRECLGHYLDYGPVRPGVHGDQVHAVVVCPRGITRGIIGARESKHHKTVAAARAWIESVATGQQCLAV